MNDMTNQEIFDKVVSHLGEQLAKSVTTGGTCLYHSPEGLMCAIGCLIKVGSIRHDSTNMSPVESPTIRVLLMEAGIDSRNGSVLRLLKHLQRIHDNNAIELWPDYLKSCGRMHELDISSVDKAFA